MTKAVHDEAPLDQKADVADNMAEAGSAVLVQVGEEDDMTNVVEDQGTVNFQVPGIDGGGVAEVPEGADTAPVDNGGAARVPVEGGGAVQVPVDAKGGAEHVRDSEYLLQPVEVVAQFILSSRRRGKRRGPEHC